MQGKDFRTLPDNDIHGRAFRPDPPKNEVPTSETETFITPSIHIVVPEDTESQDGLDAA